MVVAGRVAARWLEARGNFSTLAMFDFDGTLFKDLAEKPEWWNDPTPYSWGSDTRTLEAPCVPDRPGGSFWNMSVVADARQAVRDPSTYVVLITGRVKAFGPRVRELLKQQGIAPDALYFNPGLSPVSYKKKVFSTLLVTYSSIQRVHIWENENITVYGSHIKQLSQVLDRPIALETTLVQGGSYKVQCGPEDFAT